MILGNRTSKGYEEWEEGKGFLFIALHLVLFSNLFPSIDLFKALFLIPWFISIVIFRVPVKLIFLSILVTVPLLLIQSIGSIPKINTTYLVIFNRFFNLNDCVSEWLDSHYSPSTSEIIKLLVFNVKNESELYKEFSDLGIVHLVTVSGLHFSILSKCLLKLSKNKRFLVFPLLFVYFASVNYSIPTLRSLLSCLIVSDNRYKKWSLVTLFSLPFNVSIYKTISFQLSYIIPLIFIVTGSYTKKPLLSKTINCVTAWLYSSLLLLYINKKIHPLSIFNLVIFHYIVLFMYVYFFITWPLFSLYPIHDFIFNSFNYLQSSLELNKWYLDVAWWRWETTVISLLLFSLLLVIFQARQMRRREKVLFLINQQLWSQ